MGEKRNINFNKSRIYFVFIVLLIIASFATVFVLDLRTKNKAFDFEEARIHDIDKIYADMFIDAKNQGKSTDLVFVEDPYSYVAVINAEGDAITYSSGRGAGTATSNVFKYLNTGKFVGVTYQEALDKIVSGTYGRIEFYTGNQSKMLVYTPIVQGEYSVVRILPKRRFIEARKDYAEPVSEMLILQSILFVCMLILTIHLMRYTLKVEESYKRQTIIAVDNELVSFTYHASIASFEMTGAVASVFGEEIGKRGQVDWNTLSRLLHPDDQMMLRNISKAIKKGDTKYTTEFRLIDGEGNYHWYRLNGKCVQKGGSDASKFVGTIQNSDDQISHENMLKNKAEHDLLTGLLNKITIQEAVDVAILNATYSIYAFYIIDLDNFKAVNDNLGHAAGDKVLTDVAGKLQLVFNEADYIGRLGGDEFAVLLVIPSVMTSQAEKLIREKAKLLNEMLRATYSGDNIDINVSASIGIAIYPEDGGDFSTLYQHADRALYHSKENGKDQFTFYTEVE